MALSSTAKRLVGPIVLFHLVFFALYYHFGYQRLTDIHWLPDSSFRFFTKPKPRKLYQLLPINSDIAGARFCKTLLSSVVHGYEPLILNWELQGEVGDMQRQKVIGVYDFIINNLTATDDNDVIFMMDAMDIWLQQSPSALLRRYEELNGTGVVVGGDVGCYPNDWDSPECQDAPESPFPEHAFEPLTLEYAMSTNGPRWANSGAVIGPVAPMRSLYKELADYVRNHTNIPDQGVFNEYLLKRRISLDYWFRLFWTNSRNWDSSAIVNTRYPVDGIPPSNDPTIPYDLLPPLLYHTKTGEIPVAIHFNDYQHKELMEEWWGRLWWTKSTGRFWPIVLDRLKTGKIAFAHNGSTVVWMDLCRHELPHIFAGVDPANFTNAPV